jgi:hypothetical protein
MDGKAKARAAAVIVLTLMAGLSIALMYSVGGTFQALWFWATIGGWIVVLAVSWTAAGALSGKRAEAERYRMPVRPQTTTVPSLESPRREALRSNRTIEMPRRDGVVRPSSLAASAALPRAELVGAAEEPTLEPQVEAPEEPEPEPPAGYVFRGFTLYERTQKGKPVRFFSKKGPVGGGHPVLLPEGHDVRWDGKHRRPVLVPPKRPEPEEPMAEPAPAKVLGKTPKAAAPPPFELPEPTAKPCSAMTSPGVFCSNPAKTGGLYCARHVSYKAAAILEPKVEVTHDSATARGKAPKFALPPFEVQLDRAVHRPTKARKPHTVKLEVREDRATHEPAKPIKPRTVELKFRTDRATPEPRKAKPAKGPPVVEVAHDHVEHKPYKMPKRPHTVEVEIHEDKVHPMSFELRSTYDPTKAKVVTARGMPPNGKGHGAPKKKSAHPTELVVEKDSRKRSSVGLETTPRRKGGGRKR